MKTPEEWWAISQRHTTQPAGFIKLIEAIQRDAIESIKLKMEKLKNELKQLRKEKLELSNFNRQLLEIMDAQIIEIEQSYKRELEKISKP